MKKPELLSPAGTLKAMRYALAFGADAIYAGQPRYSLRARNNEFNNDNLAKGIAETHQLNKRFFVALNSMPHNAKVKTFMADIEPIIAMKPDALIMADPGLMMMVREQWPEMPIHLSVQMNTVNYASVKFWHEFGVERIVLSRELGLNEIEEIRQECPDTELEVFVHGALCIAYSGRCLLSGYFNHRDPNQGTCTNSCRWEYKTHEAQEDETGIHLAKAVASPVKEEAVILSPNALNNAGCGDQERHPLADKTYLLEESARPGEYMPVMEDENGTYIMNSKDLRAVEHVQRLCEIGVDCFKIEGRTKSHYYAARTAQTYRQAIDDAVDGKAFDTRLLGVLGNLANRGYTDGFFQRHHTHEYQNYIENASKSVQQQFVGEVIGTHLTEGYIEVDVKNHFALGDSIELIMPQGDNKIFDITQMTNLNGKPMDKAPGSGYQVRIYLDQVSEQMNMALMARFLT